MGWFKRLLGKPEAGTGSTTLQKAQLATDQQRLDNLLRRNNGCYMCGSSQIRVVEAAPPIGWEPIKWYACDTHYSTLFKAVNGSL